VPAKANYSRLMEAYSQTLCTLVGHKAGVVTVVRAISRYLFCEYLEIGFIYNNARRFIVCGKLNTEAATSCRGCWHAAVALGSAAVQQAL